MKRVLIFLVISVLMLGTVLTGCYKPDEGFTPINPGVLPEKIEGKDYESLGLEPYPEPVKITVAAVEFPVEGGVPASTKPENQSFNRIAKKYLNIELDYKVVATASNFDTRLNLAVGAGRTPDMFYTTDPALFSSLMRNNALADLGDSFYYLNQDLQDIYLKYMPELLPNCMIEGKLYAFPMASNKYETAQRLYIRKDWLDKLDLQAPKTIDELKAVGKAFYDNAAQLGQTQAKIIPLAMHKDVTWSGTQSASGFFNSFGASATAYFDNGAGDLIASATSPEMKNAITVLADLYKNKILDQEFISKNVDMVSADVASGKVGMVFGEWFYPLYKLETAVLNHGAEWIDVELPTFGTASTPTPVVKRVNLTGYNVVSKDCKYPEAAAKLINLFYNIYYNDDAEAIYGADVKPENGFFHNFVPIKLWDSLSSIAEFKRVNSVFDDAYAAGARADFRILSTSEQNALAPAQKTAYESQLIIYNKLRTREKTLHWDTGWPYFCALKAGKTLSQMTVKEKEGWSIYHEMINPDGTYAYVSDLTEGRKTAKYDEFFGLPTSQMVIYGEQLNTSSAVAYTSMITGSKPLSYWDTFVSQYNKEGGEKVIKQLNAWYDAQWKPEAN